MTRYRTSILISVAALAAGTPASARGACQERTLSLRYSPQSASARYWCWAASGQMVMEWLGEEPSQACQCRQAEQVLGVKGCCVTPRACVPAEGVRTSCDEPRWPAFVERPDRYAFDYRTTCDELKQRQDDNACRARPLAWRELTIEICAGRPVLAAFRSPGSALGHLIVVKGFSTHPTRRVLVVDPRRLCPPGRDCEGELDEGFWLSYEEYAAGWAGLVHWVDFYGIRRGHAPAQGRPENLDLRPSTGSQSNE